MSITRVGQKEKGRIGATKVTQLQREGMEKGGREKKRKGKKKGERKGSEDQPLSKKGVIGLYKKRGKEKEVKINHYPKRA